jgi:hypothetical protein
MFVIRRVEDSSKLVEEVLNDLDGSIFKIINDKARISCTKDVKYKKSV